MLKGCHIGKKIVILGNHLWLYQWVHSLKSVHATLKKNTNILRGKSKWSVIGKLLEYHKQQTQLESSPNMKGSEAGSALFLEATVLPLNFHIWYIKMYFSFSCFFFITLELNSKSAIFLRFTVWTTSFYKRTVRHPLVLKRLLRSGGVGGVEGLTSSILSF